MHCEKFTSEAMCNHFHCSEATSTMEKTIASPGHCLAEQLSTPLTPFSTKENPYAALGG